MTKFKSMTEEEFTKLYKNLPVKQLMRALGYHDRNGKFHPISKRFIDRLRIKYGLPTKDVSGRPQTYLQFKGDPPKGGSEVISILEKVRREEFQENAGDVMEYLADKSSFKFQK